MFWSHVMAHTEPCEILTAIPKCTALPSRIFLFVHTPKCFMYLLGTLHRMLAQLIKFGLVLEMFCGNVLLNLLQPLTVTVIGRG